MPATSQRGRAWVKFGGLILIVAALYALGRVIGLDPSRFRPEVIRDTVQGFGTLAPLVFIGIYTVGPLLFFPGSVLSIAAGLAFGWKLGFLVVLVGSNLCANIAFGLAKLLGRDLVVRLAGGRLKTFDERAAEHGFKMILFLRLVPLVPFNALNYGAGLSPVRWRDYLLATLLGMIPGIFAYVYLGGNLDLRSWQFWLAVGILLAVMGVPTLYKRIKGERVPDPVRSS